MCVYMISAYKIFMAHLLLERSGNTNKSEHQQQDETSLMGCMRCEH